MLPDYVGIGAQRAATTWIYRCLQEHPEVVVATPKELHFFDEQYEKGVSWYESHFRPAPQHKVAGEITPNYLNVAHAVPRMAEVIPDARLFAVLREPVARAHSAYQLLAEHAYRGMSFRQACQNGTYLINSGLYSEQLRRVFKYYPRNRVRVLFYEDIESNPVEFLCALFRFVSVDDRFQPPSTYSRYNRIMYPRAQRILQRIGLGWTIHAARATPIGTWIKNHHVSKHAGSKLALAEVDVQWLKKQFRPDILKLQEIVGRD